MSESIDIVSNMDEIELELLSAAFIQGELIDHIKQNDGAINTFIFKVPTMHLGLSISIAPPEGDLHMSVSKWTKEPHHELDKWIWTKQDD